MKKMFFAFTVGISFVVLAEENVSSDFWNFDTAYQAPVTSVQSSTSSTAVTGVASSSVWDNMVEAFSTLMRGLSIRIW